MAIEKPSHNVMASEGNFELRNYLSYIVAETYVEGDFKTVGSEGFRRLADYIGGKNQTDGLDIPKGVENYRCASMGPIRCTLYAMVYEKKRNLNSGANPINCLKAMISKIR